MKKYLIKGLLALFGGTILASCTDHDVEYVPLAQQKTQAYDQAFKELIGGKDVDPNQNWGFEGTPASVIEEEEAPAPAPALTRGDENLDGGFTISSGDWQNFDYYDVSKVQEIIGKLPEGQAAGNKLNDYEFISKGAISFNFIYAVTSGQDEIGYYYYNPSSGINSRTEVKLINNIQQDHYSLELFTYGTASNNWTIPTINPLTDNNDCTELINSQTINQVRGRTVTLRIPVGYRIGFYIKNPDWGGLKMYSNKSLNADGYFYSAVATLSDGTYAVGLEDWIASTGGDFDCNDIVLTVKNVNLPEIINYNSSTTKRYKHRRLVAQGRVFCEDLGTAGVEDLDFNDIVFDARIWRTYEFDRIDNGEPENKTAYKYEADILMLAAGGTIPAKITTNKAYIIHDLFEGSPGQTTMINTVDGNAGTLSTWENMKANPGAKLYSGANITDIINTLIENAKKENPSRDHEITVNDIPISVLWSSQSDPTKLDWENNTMQTVGELHATKGKVPHKFCLPIGTRWPSERRNIVLAYPGFEDWATGETEDNKNFYKSPVKSYLYSDAGCDAKLDLTNSNGVEYTLGYTEDIKISETTTETTEIETVVWANSGVQLNDWGDNHLIYDDIFAKMDDTAPNNTYTIRIYGTKVEGATDWGAQLLTGNWDHIVNVFGAVRNDDNFYTKGYIEYRNISKDLVSHLKHDKGKDNGVDWSCDLQGKNFTATQISFVKTVTTSH